MLVGLAIGPLGLDLMDRAKDPEVTRTLLESALVLPLFADASGIRARDLRREEFLPLRLPAVGLPVTMALGWLAAWPLLPGPGVWELALAAIILAPTDAALGQQAFSDKRVPPLIRGGLTAESGPNDGLALPFFVLAPAAAGEGPWPSGRRRDVPARLAAERRDRNRGRLERGEPVAPVACPRVEQLRPAAVPGTRRPGRRLRLVRHGGGQRLHRRLGRRPGLRYPPAPHPRRPRHPFPGLGPRAEHQVHRPPRPRLAQLPRLRLRDPGTGTPAPDVAPGRLRAAQPHRHPDAARRTRPGRHRAATPRPTHGNEEYKIEAVSRRAGEK
ncbi:hypothetical protein Sxan_34050 [Streptomyces xanthophaeus]|uniref:Cation/H+ exchanger transmembrane domain-containing protein n=1 Tax=Streptomyces xanthophaeus TaxID=67385 RepID=A0A919GWN3_9ACTN|nr:hypothetical protein Sxan_34050 [Streptomyces xanthophaeus]